MYRLKVVHTSVSDHEPLLLNFLDVHISKKVFRFRFENMWLKEPSFIQEVSDIWAALPVSHLLPKLIEVSTFMARWGRTFFHKFREKVKKHKERLDRLVDCVDARSVQAYLDEKEKLNALLLQEEIYWKQRAKLFWLVEGDENTRFFHASATARKKANKISYLISNEGETVDDHEGMCEIVREYFNTLFTGEEDVTRMSNLTSPRMVSDAQNMKLTEEFSFNEFSTAIKQMHPDKASGPDGLNPAFFQSFWAVMGREVFEYCRTWLRNKQLPGELNCTNVVLIPKKENAVCMKDLRPIALCNVLYKIMAKVLANRLKGVLPHIISENQSAFVHSRSITDNVLVAFEVIHHMNQKKGDNMGEVALKLDISKAYDRVNWSFLRQRMKIMGFCDTWIDWMMMCVKTVTYNFSFNGSLIGPITPKKGLRQGDPLSPYLFLLCVEGLSNALDEASNNGEIHGCKICPAAPTVSHLLFADDSFLFFQGTSHEAINIKRVLLNYELCSGQAVNFQKSGVFFSANVRRDKQVEISNILGVHNDITHTKYLGLPSLVGKSKLRVFGYLKDKASKKIQSWQAKPISQAGKTVLIRNVAQAIPSYAMSCFLLPKSLCQDLEQMFNNYWWKSGSAGSQKGLNWLSWNNMSVAKSKGGIGFRNLHGFNIALLGKHVWNFLQNSNTLVARLFKARYFPDSSILKASKGGKASFIWYGIWTAKEELCKGFRWVIGNGEDIVATKDPWLRKKPEFCVEDNPIYEGRSEVVSSLFLPNEKRWNEAKIREKFLPIDAEAILTVHIPQRDTHDKIVWTNSNNGVYSVKMGYQYWYSLKFGTVNIPQSSGWKRIWSLHLPHKIKVFIWRFSRNAIPVKWRLKSRGVKIDVNCPMCMKDIEHSFHLFFGCAFALGCWDYMQLRYNLEEVEYVSDWLLERLSTAPSEEVSRICVTLWGIWYWRNKRVWDAKSVTPEFAMASSSRVYSDWVEAKKHMLCSEKTGSNGSKEVENKWKCPEVDAFKVNVDASVFMGAQTFSSGMVLRDHRGEFIAGQTMCFSAVGSVFEAEAIGVREALSWIEDQQLQGAKVTIESDSMLTVNAILSKKENHLEVGEIIEDCKQRMRVLPGISIRFVRKNANKVAHEVARLPCVANSKVYFTSPPTCLLEALAFDLVS